MKLKDRVAIVTGGGTGIGQAIAIALGSEGANVILAARTLSRLEETAADIIAKTGRAKSIQMDISDELQVQRMVSKTIEEYGRIDILVNNSSANARASSIVGVKLQDWNEILAASLTGTMICSREVLKHMISRKTGSIVNISSVAGISGTPNANAYSIAKWGVIGLTEMLAIEVGKYNIRVNCVSPGATKTEAFEKVARSRAQILGIPTSEWLSRLYKHNSLGRIADPREIAAAVVFLASDDASAITGENLVVSCGFHMLHLSEVY